MTRYIALLAVLCAQILLISCESCSLLEREEGTSILYYALFLERSVVLPIVWKVLTPSDVIEVASCDLSLECKNYFPSEFSATVRSHNTSYGTSRLFVSLNITSLNRTMRGLQMEDKAYASRVCKFRIFTRPVNLTCSRPEIENEFIKVTCTNADQVLPKPVCLFDYLPKYPPLQYSVTYDDSLRECTLTGRPTSFTSQAEYSFRLQMYPDVTDGQTYSVSTGGWTPPLAIQRTTTSTSTTFPLSSRGVQPYMWAPPVAGVVIFLLIFFLFMLIHRAKMWRKQEQRVSRPHPSVLPSLLHSSRRTGAYREQPVRTGPNVYFTNASGGRVTCDPPPYEELPAVAGNLGGTHDSTDTTSGHDMQQIVTPPPYDTVCKPGDLPPPYTDFSE